MNKVSDKKQVQLSHKKSATVQKAKKRLNPKRFAVAVAVVVFVSYFIYVMIWQQITLSKKNKEINELEEKISIASQETEALQKELDNLEDPEYLERIAREKLGLVRPNERVFIDANKSESNVSD